MTLADQKNIRTGSVCVSRMPPEADFEVDSQKTNPPTREIAAANASISKDS